MSSIGCMLGPSMSMYVMHRIHAGDAYVVCHGMGVPCQLCVPFACVHVGMALVVACQRA